MTSRSDRDERVARLAVSAEERSARTFASARRAIIQLQSRHKPVTRSAVAALAGCSVSYLDKNALLKAEIRKARRSGRIANPVQSRNVWKSKFEAATERAREQGREIEQLHRELEALRGEVLRLRNELRRPAPRQSERP